MYLPFSFTALWRLPLVTGQFQLLSLHFLVFFRSFFKCNLVYREECPMKIDEYFVENNYVTQEEVNEALESAKTQ